MVLGLGSLVASYYTALCAVTAVLGLGLGVGGLYSSRRGTAVMGILVCCLALLSGGFFGSVAWYESRFGHKPWDTPAEIEAEVLPVDG